MTETGKNYTVCKKKAMQQIQSIKLSIEKFFEI